MQVRYLSGKGFHPLQQNSVWTHAYFLSGAFLCSSGVYFRCIVFNGASENQTLKVGPIWMWGICSKIPASLKMHQKYKSVLLPCTTLRFMHFRNLHHCLFKCRNYWIDCLTFRTFLSCPALSKYFDLKSQRFLHFRNLHHRFSHPQSLTEISITFLPERFVNLHHKSPCCFSPNV